MKLGIMQPYLFPYIGYYQLIKAVDKHVIYDDVNYIKQGWINRNRILLNGEEKMITLSVQGASSYKKINEIDILNNNDKILKTIEHAYNKAPYFQETYELVNEILSFTNSNLGAFLSNSIKRTCKALNIDTEIINSSELHKNCELKGQEKVINICRLLECDIYYNAIGGKELYTSEEFDKYNIKLFFLKSCEISYKQFKNDFIPWLSIIDVMMFNSPTEISKMLENYKLI